MLTKDADKKREQMIVFCMDDMVPQNHMLRLIDKAINWKFIYDLVEEKYSADNGRPSMDPVMLIKIPFIQYLYGIRSMRQTIKEIEVNVAYRWFLGLDMLDPVPHFSTFGKNYTRRFKDTGLFEQIFAHILEECMKHHLVDTAVIFVDATHVKACANSKKMRKRVAKEQALWFEEELKKEINDDRENHGKKPLKEKKDDQTPPSSGGGLPDDFPKGGIPEDAKLRNAAQRIRRADGSAKENISMFLLMPWRLPVIKTAGYLAIAFTLEMNMTAGRLKNCMISWSVMGRK